MMTTSEYLRTPETVLPRELAYGVLRVADSPTVPHQRIVRDVTIALTLYTREHRLGEVMPAPMDVVLDYDDALVVQPDVLFVARGREAVVRDRVYGPPDLVVEVLSPHPRIGDLDARLGWFAKYGVRECWLIDVPTRTITVLELATSGVEDGRRFAGARQIVSRVLGEVPLSADSLFAY